MGISFLERSQIVNKKEIKKLDYLIGYLSEYSDRIKCIRIATGINTDYSFLKEAETIESLYEDILQYRKEEKSSYFSVGTSGWTIEYLRDKKTYKKGEKFKVKVHFSFVEFDTYK